MAIKDNIYNNLSSMESLCRVMLSEISEMKREIKKTESTKVVKKVKLKAEISAKFNNRLKSKRQGD